MSAEELYDMMMEHATQLPVPDTQGTRKLLGNNPKPCQKTHYATDKCPYGSVYWNGDNWPAHRFVHWHKTGELPEQVRHLCGREGCIEHTHLAGGTAKDNRMDSVLHGSGANLFSDEEALEILQEWESGLPQKLLCDKHDASPSAIHNLIHGITYSHLPRPKSRRMMNYNGHGKNTVGPADRIRMKRMYEKGSTLDEIKEHFGLGCTRIVPGVLRSMGVAIRKRGQSGENHHQSKLSDAEKEKIKADYATGIWTQAELAAWNDVSRPTISRILE